SLLLLSNTTTWLPAQVTPEADHIEVYDEKTGDRSIGIFANNSSYAPISLTIDFPMKKNITIPVALPYTVVVPPRSENCHLFDIKMAKGKAASFEYGYGMVIGDVLTAKHQEDFVYQLPFPKEKSYLIGQGYGGRFSHKGVNAIDFNMPVGSKVTAARAGTVVFTKNNGSKSCKNKGCSDHANYVIILHEDGSFAQYVHLKKEGVLVKPGQKVKAGELIAYSGNTGWSSGPHLHFEVFVPVPNGYMTLPTKFNTKNHKAAYLTEMETYGH
ncbi:MAG TPA: M23 family metallopeptidase, partial [Phaeodactylibacter sp.]|nr:M23 family metallopeptidase [Phaeodactylibacter sp.]